jgi:hypothetical protein
LRRGALIPRRTKVRIGDMLVSGGEITEEQLQAALAEQRDRAVG